MHPEKLLDLLVERLTFERTTIKLYDSVIAKLSASKDASFVGGMIPQIAKCRNEEKDHEVWLESQIRMLNGNPEVATDLSDLIERESKGIRDVVAHDSEVNHLLHALMIAELVDDNGWKLLLELADEAGDDDARQAFRQRAQTEQRHVSYFRTIMASVARRDVLGRQMRVPTTF